MGRSVTSQRGLLRADGFLARDERFIRLNAAKIVTPVTDALTRTI